MKGKVALVTGAGSGIGRAIAQAFANKGAKVMVADIVEQGGMETVKLIQDAGGEAAFVKVDVSKEEQVKAMVDKTVETLGGLNYAANNAGIDGPPAPIHGLSLEDWQKVIDVNLTGVFLGIKYEAMYMLEHGGGAIVNTSSFAGLRGVDYMGAYVASKHGVTGLTRTAALEYSKLGIRVNSVHPGGIRTPMIEQFIKMRPEMGEQMNTNHPIGRIGEPREIADSVVWLCSDEASFVTGLAMAVDGGMSAK